MDLLASANQTVLGLPGWLDDGSGFELFGGGQLRTAPRCELGASRIDIFDLIQCAIGVFIKFLHFVQVERARAAPAEDHGLISRFVHDAVAIQSA